MIPERPVTGSIAARVRRGEATAATLEQQPDAPLDDEELLTVASDLVAWGVRPAAMKVVGVLRRRTDRFDRELDALEQTLVEPAKRRQHYEETFLAHALNVPDDPEASPTRLLVASHTLLIWGAFDEAERALKRLERTPEYRPAVGGMRAAIQQLRASGIMESAIALGEGEPAAGFNAPREAMVVKGTGDPETAIIAFTGAARNFWVSLQVFHRLLSPHAGHVIYLADHANGAFYGGLTSVAPSYAALLGFLRAETAKLGIRRTYVLAASSGGFVGLRAAADLPAAGFLGFSIATDLTGRLPITTLELRARAQCADPDLMIDLAPYLNARFAPARAIVFAPEGREMERLQAVNLKAVRRFDVRLLDDDEHDSVKTLIQRGQMKPLLEEFFARHKRPAAIVDD